MLSIVQAQVTFKLAPDNTQVLAGEDASFYITLKNQGTKSLSNILISVNLPQEFGGQRNISVNSIGSGATYMKTVQIVTYDTTKLGNYSVNATLRYGGEVIEYPNVNLEVLEFPLSLYYHFQNQNMKAGDQNSLIVTVKNIGDDTLTNLNMDLSYPGGFITNMSRNLYLPEVVSNLEISREFVFIAPADANGDYHVGIKVGFKQDDKFHSVEEFAKVSVQGSPTFGWLETLLTIMIVILIGLILLGKAK
jgi:uncharacterized membrane protein